MVSNWNVGCLQGLLCLVLQFNTFLRLVVQLRHHLLFPLQALVCAFLVQLLCLPDFLSSPPWGVQNLNVEAIGLLLLFSLMVNCFVEDLLQDRSPLVPLAASTQGRIPY